MTTASLRHKPDCGHQRLAQCPLTKDDWDVIFHALLAFRYTCRLVSERAHAREQKALAKGDT